MRSRKLLSMSAAGLSCQLQLQSTSLRPYAGQQEDEAKGQQSCHIGRYADHYRVSSGQAAAVASWGNYQAYDGEGKPVIGKLIKLFLL